jgi:hypothetical protein
LQNESATTPTSTSASTVQIYILQSLPDNAESNPTLFTVAITAISTYRKNFFLKTFAKIEMNRQLYL